MQVTVLVDNSPGNGTRQLCCEHGLSFLIEHNGVKILCDMGATGLFAGNARELGIDLSTVDFAFLSHGHNDHSGGLYTIPGITDRPVYIHRAASEYDFFSSRRGEKRYIGTDHNVLNSLEKQIIYLNGNSELTPGIFAIQCKGGNHARPYGNRFLTKEDGTTEQPDDFVHELSLSFITPDGLVIVSPCSHCGALNIIEAAIKVTGCNRVAAFIGGLHFVESEVCMDEASGFAKEMNRLLPDTVVYTGHCTCDKAKRVLEKELKRVRFFNTGSVIEVTELGK